MKSLRKRKPTMSKYNEKEMHDEIDNLGEQFNDKFNVEDGASGYIPPTVSKTEVPPPPPQGPSNESGAIKRITRPVRTHETGSITNLAQDHNASAEKSVLENYANGKQSSTLKILMAQSSFTRKYEWVMFLTEQAHTDNNEESLLKAYEGIEYILAHGPEDLKTIDLDFLDKIGKATLSKIREKRDQRKREQRDRKELQSRELGFNNNFNGPPIQTTILPQRTTNENGHEKIQTYMDDLYQDDRSVKESNPNCTAETPVNLHLEYRNYIPDMGFLAMEEGKMESGMKLKPIINYDREGLDEKQVYIWKVKQEQSLRSNLRNEDKPQGTTAGHQSKGGNDRYGNHDQRYPSEMKREQVVHSTPIRDYTTKEQRNTDRAEIMTWHSQILGGNQVSRYQKKALHNNVGNQEYIGGQIEHTQSGQREQQPIITYPPSKASVKFNEEKYRLIEGHREFLERWSERRQQELMEDEEEDIHNNSTWEVGPKKGTMRNDYHENNQVDTDQEHYRPDGNSHGVRRTSLRQGPEYRPQYEPSIRITLNQAFNSIPEFDGNPDTLPLFRDALRNVVRQVGKDNERTILFSLASKLKGKVGDGYRLRLNYYNSVEDLLTELSTQYSRRGGVDRIMAELKIVRQNEGESAVDYGLRVKTLLHRILNIYDSDRTLLDSQRINYKRKVEIEAAEQYQLGLLGGLEHQVRSMQPRTLTDAIAVAADFEEKTSTRRLVEQDRKSPEEVLRDLLLGMDFGNTVRRTMATSDVRCDYCKATGHTEDKCRKKKYESKRCEYCNGVGHVYNECFKLEAHIRNGKLQADQIDAPSAQNSGQNLPAVTQPAGQPLLYLQPTYQSVPVTNNTGANQPNGNGQGQSNQYDDVSRDTRNVRFQENDRSHNRDRGYNDRGSNRYGDRYNNRDRRYDDRRDRNNDHGRSYDNRSNSGNNRYNSNYDRRDRFRDNYNGERSRNYDRRDESRDRNYDDRNHSRFDRRNDGGNRRPYNDHGKSQSQGRGNYGNNSNNSYNNGRDDYTDRGRVQERGNKDSYNNNNSAGPSRNNGDYQNQSNGSLNSQDARRQS